MSQLALMPIPRPASTQLCTTSAPFAVRAPETTTSCCTPSTTKHHRSKTCPQRIMRMQLCRVRSWGTSGMACSERYLGEAHTTRQFERPDRSQAHEHKRDLTVDTL